MNEIFKKGSVLFLKLLVAGIMCFFVIMSFSVLATAAFTENIGYKAYGTSAEGGESLELYTHYYSDGEDTLKAEYEDRGYTVTESSIRSEISGTGNAVFQTVVQIFCLLITLSFVYPDLWHIGTTDSNLVKFKHKAEDKLKGLKIGLIAVIPQYLLLICAAIAKFGLSSKLPAALLKFANASFYTFIQLIIGNAATLGELSAFRFALLWLLPLIIPAAACGSYYLGYRNISIGEKIVYKKK